MNTGAQGVDHQFRDADKDGTDTLVPNTKNLLTVAARNNVNIVWWTPLVNSFLDLIRLRYVEEAAFWPSE